MIGQGDTALLESLESIREELADECREITHLLELATDRNLKFKVGIEEIDMGLDSFVREELEVMCEFKSALSEWPFPE